MGVHLVQPIPELVEGGDVQGQVRDLEGLPAGQDLDTQLLLLANHGIREGLIFTDVASSLTMAVDR